MSAIGRATGAISAPLSAPRTQCGTITFSALTPSWPSAFIVATAQVTACSRAREPLSRLPIRSVR
ncbi:MAG TPA: hypothetical protein VK698_11615 [Kofleriaceae bacterium]|nr:hypothetical protein [Kofleriaceae bacterium]